MTSCANETPTRRRHLIVDRRGARSTSGRHDDASCDRSPACPNGASSAIEKLCTRVSGLAGVPFLRTPRYTLSGYMCRGTMPHCIRLCAAWPDGCEQRADIARTVRAANADGRSAGDNCCQSGYSAWGSAGCPAAITIRRAASSLPARRQSAPGVAERPGAGPLRNPYPETVRLLANAFELDAARHDAPPQPLGVPQLRNDALLK